MKQRTKDLILIYTCFIIFAIVIFFLMNAIQTFKQSQQPTLQEQTEEVSIVYDSSVKRPAANVQVVEQLPEFPSGDEFAAAISFLRAYGYDLNFYSLLNDMNYSDTDYIECYVGDAKTEQGFCYAPALVICMNNYLSAKNADIRTQNLSEMTFKELEEYVNSSGQPLIVWYTLDGAMPQYEPKNDDNYAQRYSNAQVIVVSSIRNDKVYAADSLNGELEIPKNIFKQVWQACGSQCIGAYYVEI